MHVTKLFLYFCLCLSTGSLHAFTLMLSPAGDTHHPGRIIDGCYERGVALQLAEQLQEAIHKDYPEVIVLLTRSPGQRLESLQQATVANRLSVDLYLVVLLYEQKSSQPHLALYTYATDPTDALKTISVDSLQFLPFDQAHLISRQQSSKWATALLAQLQQIPLFTIPGDKVYTLPLKNLAGVHAPHIAIELSIQEATDITKYVPSLVKALGTIIAPGDQTT